MWMRRRLELPVVWIVLMIQLLFPTALSDNHNNDSSTTTTRRRRLELDEIAGYEPWTVVTDVNAIDLDFRLVQQQMDNVVLAYRNNGENAFGLSYDVAYDVYLRGGHVAPYAQLQLDQPLAADGGLLQRHKTVLGTSRQGTRVRGYLLHNHADQSPVIQVAYLIQEDPQNYAGCRVGALPLVQAQLYDGCFQSTGTVQIEGVADPLGYSYVVETDNLSRITLASLSRNAQSVLLDCHYCPYAPFTSYHAYYGVANYGDIFVQAAFQGTQTNVYNRGKADFRNVGLPARAKAVRVGILVLNVWMEVHRHLQDAVQNCQTTRDARKSWDLAAAVYTGSLEGRDGFANGGQLWHQAADQACVRFHTCGTESSSPEGKSYVNYEILNRMRTAQRFFAETPGAAGQCGKIDEAREAIGQAMVIPLVQNLLLVTFQRSIRGDNDEELRAEGAAYASAVVPLVFAQCSQDDATVLHNQMGMGSGRPDFGLVKRTLQRHYACLGVTCAQIGGYINPTTNDYYHGAHPCVDGNDDDTGGGSSPGPTLQPTTVAPAPPPPPQEPVGSTETTPPPTTETFDDTDPEAGVVVVAVLGGFIGVCLLGLVVNQAVRRKAREAKQELHDNALRFELGKDGDEIIEFAEFT